MLLLVCSIVLFLGSVQGFTHEDANNYIERVLEERFPEELEYSRLEPYKLEDIHLKLNDSGKEVGSAVLYKGRLVNLSKVRRAADCTVPFWQYSNITFTCFLKFEDLKITYEANATLKNAGLVFYPKATVRGTNVTVQITSSPEDDVPSLNLMFVNHIGRLNVTAQMVSIGDLSLIVGPPVRAALVKHSMLNLYKVLHGRFKSALAFSIYKTPVAFAG